jgi:hypothetical protein
MFDDGGYIEAGCVETPQQKARRKMAEVRPRKAAVGAKYRKGHAAKIIFTGLKRRAKEKGLDFDLTLEWIEAKLKIEFCEATGIRFVGAGKDPFGRTFDRKDSAAGYTMANTWVACWIYNRAKLDGTHADVLELAIALLRAEAARRD